MATLMGLVAVQPTDVLPSAILETAFFDAEYSRLPARFRACERHGDADSREKELVGGGADHQTSRRPRYQCTASGARRRAIGKRRWRARFKTRRESVTIQADL